LDYCHYRLSCSFITFKIAAVLNEKHSRRPGWLFPKLLFCRMAPVTRHQVFGGPMSGEFSNRLISVVMSKPQHDFAETHPVSPLVQTDRSHRNNRSRRVFPGSDSAQRHHAPSLTERRLRRSGAVNYSCTSTTR
jgi:hypothetical protein